MECKICSNKSKLIFTKTVLAQFKVKYYQCDSCSFIQTEDPYWLGEAYSLGAISALDVGIMSRNLWLQNKTSKILKLLFSDFISFSAIDYGGGEGIFVRLMRDKGFNFYRQDLHADNVYARYFDIKDLPASHKFNILTAYEVFEHLANPVEELKEMFKFSDIVLLSTELQPFNDISELEQWWYFVPETGQHLSFYTEDAFKELAKRFNVYYYTDSLNLHMLSKKKFDRNPLIEEKTLPIKKTLLQRVVYKINDLINHNPNHYSKDSFPKSLISDDFENVKKKLQNKSF